MDGRGGGAERQLWGFPALGDPPFALIFQIIRLAGVFACRGLMFMGVGVGVWRSVGVISTSAPVLTSLFASAFDYYYLSGGGYYMVFSLPVERCASSSDF